MTIQQDTQFPQRKSPRMDGYDYATPGIYFLTLCTHQRRPLFGSIHQGKMYLNSIGKHVNEQYLALAASYPHLHIEDYVIMPNHFHCLLSLHAHAQHGISSVMARFKYLTTRAANLSFPLWQRSFHDHIVRNSQELEIIRNYIATNPLRWEADRFFSVD